MPQHLKVGLHPPRNRFNLVTISPPGSSRSAWPLRPSFLIKLHAVCERESPSPSLCSVTALHFFLNGSAVFQSPWCSFELTKLVGVSNCWLLWLHRVVFFAFSFLGDLYRPHGCSRGSPGEFGFLSLIFPFSLLLAFEAAGSSVRWVRSLKSSRSGWYPNLHCTGRRKPTSAMFPCQSSCLSYEQAIVSNFLNHRFSRACVGNARVKGCNLYEASYNRPISHGLQEEGSTYVWAVGVIATFYPWLSARDCHSSG